MKKGYLALTLLGLLLVLPTMALADGSLGSTTCGSGSAVTLGNDNNSTIDIDITVCVDGNTVTVAGISWAGATNTPLGIDMFFWNSSGTLLQASGTTTGWSQEGCGNLNPPPAFCQADGFGGYLGNAAKPASDDLVGTQWTLDGAPGSDLAVHIRFNDNCSGFVSTRPEPTGTLGTGCSGSEVPEPASLTLLGTGLLGLGGMLRKKLGKKA